VHPPAIRAKIRELIAAGVNDCEISRRTGIPRATVRDIRRPPYVRKIEPEVCPRCWRAAKPMRFTPDDYAELLGLYLGDRCISQHPRTTRLRITLDLKYPQIIEDARAMLARCMPSNGVDVSHGGTTGNCVNVSVYSQHLPCLFPQHGPGKKHERHIELEPWQERLVEAAPWALLCGLIRSDGCAFVNRTDIHRPEPYEYLSYAFSNKSAGIVDLFTRSCESVGVEYRRTLNERRAFWAVRINRRASVQLMLDNIGLKR
jgi:hypothetical protein